MKRFYETHNIDPITTECWLDKVLEDQGLEYKDGEIVEIPQENEDEMIRKALLEYFGEECDTATINGIYCYKIYDWLEKQGEQYVPSKELILNVWELGNIWKEITKGICNAEHGTQLDYILKHWNEGEHYTEWLEKQGKQKNKINSYKIIFEDVLALECAMKTIKRIEGGNELYEILVSLYNKIHNAYLIEKQDEQKDINPTLLEKEKMDSAFTKMMCKGKTALETIHEEKVDNANKVEPKFHEGDWIVNNDTKDVFLIKSINNGYCTLEDIKGNIISPCLPPCESRSHIWTIQDAKDGDVLLFEGYYNSIVLFQGIGINGKGHINYHCKCDLGNYLFGIQGDVAYLGTIEKSAERYHPATKEQRDLLFSKIHEAGYEWDEEKKELRQKESNRINEDERIRKMIINHLTQERGSLSNDEAAEAISWLEKQEQKPQVDDFDTELKENEDDRVKKELMEFLVGKRIISNDLEGINIDKTLTWLKKQGNKSSIYSQNKRKPSKEQIVALRWILNNIPYNKHKEEISKLLDQIKEL